MQITKTNIRTLVAVILTSLIAICGFAGDTKYATLSNAQSTEILNTVENDLKANYYDPKMHGVDLDQRFDEARQKIATAKSQDEALLDIAAAVAALKDSHTRFHPPTRPYGVVYGWVMQAIGESNCYVTGVRPDSDAAAKGLKAGDLVVSLNGISVVRADISYLQYSYRVFPQSGFHVTVRPPDGSGDQNLVVMSKVIPGQYEVRRGDVQNYRENHRDDRFKNRSRYYNVNKQVLFWKLPDFVMSADDADDVLNKARSYETVILDLRGNPGGRVIAEAAFLGGFFDHDVKLGVRVGRTESKEEKVKSRGGKAFAGKLIVLIDSDSKSAAEIFARVIQLEKRGTVLGDRSAGAVMESKVFVHAEELDRVNVAQYRTSITIANIIMADGVSLENLGVTPDQLILPTPADIAAGRDPVLARAAELAGVKMTPEEAGKIFPLEWAEEKMHEID
ncbi:MAG TPA: S41 family peptidase [Candidatus Acidoferrales bacterium]